MAAGNTTKEVWARRLALQITTQLPESEEDAIEVLGYARELVTFVSHGRARASKAVLSVIAINRHVEEK